MNFIETIGVSYMDKQQLASTIWESANQMRSKIEASEYKDFILGFIFYKYLSEKELRFLKKSQLPDEKIKELSEEDEEYARFVRQNLGYFISYDQLFSTWLEKGADFDISDVRDSLSAFERNIDSVYKKVFENIFNTLSTGLSKLGENAQKQTKAARSLLRLINRIPMGQTQDYDVLGFIYEYLISMFAANAGKKAGEFYTPHEVSQLMSEIVAEHLKDRESIQIYDPTSGSGSLLINIGKAAAKYLDSDNRIEYFAQELKENTYNLTRMNLVMRDIKPANINVRNGDTLEDDWPFFEDERRDSTYELVRVDAVVSNPPYSQKWSPNNKEMDPRYKEYGLAPKGKADYAFLLHDLYHLKDDGIMTIVLPHGVLFRGSAEGEIRKNLIEKDKIDAIIGLPANVFFGTGIPTIIMVLKQNRTSEDILIIDASKGFEKAGKQNRLRASDIKKITDTIRDRVEIDKYSALISKEQIRDNDYNLNIPRYVDSSEPAENYDFYATMFGGIPESELKDLDHYWKALPGLRESIFHSVNDSCYDVDDEYLEEQVKNHSSVEAYFNSYRQAFSGFRKQLVDDLIDGILDVNIHEEHEAIIDSLFNRLENVALVDRYQGYQVLADNWNTIEADLEIIDLDGFDAINQVDPNMVVKKKKDSDDEVPEVQEGWRGRIIPFDLVQKTILREDSNAIQSMEERQVTIQSDFQEIIDSLDEDERESNLLNEEGTAFEVKEVKSYLDEAYEDIETPEILALNQYLTLSKKAEKESFINSHGEVDWQQMETNKQGTYNKKEIDRYLASLQANWTFEEDSLEDKIQRVVSLMDEESELKKSIKQDKEALHLRTKDIIESLEEADALNLLELKWIQPLIDDLDDLVSLTIKSLIEKIQALKKKYDRTITDIDREIVSTEKELALLTSQLRGSTSEDMKALEELRDLLEVRND